MTNDDMIIKLNNQKIRKQEKMLQNIELLCQDVLDYETELTVEGLATMIINSISYNK